VAATEVKSVASRRFWDLFHALPHEIQTLAAKNYKLWSSNPAHPSLHFHRLKGSPDRYSVRVGDHHRALGRLSADTMLWVWIGTEYDRLVGQD
jgi:hypothetical protein